MPTLACLNGVHMPVEDAKVSVWDRGFLFGDAIYEVYRLYEGRCWLERAHDARLRRSLEEMEFPRIDFDALKRRLHFTIEESGIREGTAYIQITRGVAPRLHAFPDPTVSPTELIIIRPYDDTETAQARTNGVAVISYPDLRWKHCDVKSTNLLANVIANNAAHRAGAYEAVLVGQDGLITEATHSSLLWIREGRLEGTPEGQLILPGTTRQFEVTLASDAGLRLAASRVTLDELTSAEEVILLGTTIEVMPVVSIDGRPVGSGRPGPQTVRLQDAFRSAVRRWLADSSD
jgi:D-alanine transaminase